MLLLLRFSEPVLRLRVITIRNRFYALTVPKYTKRAGWGERMKLDSVTFANAGVHGQCSAVLLRLQDEYVEARTEGDVLEGAVLIGDVPVPQYYSSPSEPDYGYMPLDQVYRVKN